MVLGIVGMPTGMFWAGIPCSLLAIIFGHIAFSKISKHPEYFLGRGMAVAGFTLGYVGLILGIYLAIILMQLEASIEQILEQLNTLLGSSQNPFPHSRF
jgi:hypothetical protein